MAEKNRSRTETRENKNVDNSSYMNEMLTALKTPLNNLGTLVCTSTLYFFSMLFYAGIIYSKPLLEFAGVPNLAALMQALCIALSLFMFILALGCLAQYSERSATKDKHACWKFSAGLRLFVVLSVAVVAYTTIHFLPETLGRIIHIIYGIFLILCLPTILIKTAVTDSIMQGLHGINKLVSVQYLKQLGQAALVFVAYSLLTFGITQALALLGSTSTIAYYVTTLISLCVTILLFCAASMTVIRLFTNELTVK